MLKKIIGSTVFASLVLGLTLLLGQVALAQSGCTVNGQEVPCEEAAQQAKNFAGLGIGIFAIFIIAGIAGTIFWIMMLVHAASHPVENKAMWIILMVFTGIVGAFIYYFAVKRKFNKPSSTPTPLS